MNIFTRFLLAAVIALPGFANASVLYIDPGEGSYGLGDTFMVNVRLDNEEECINAAQVVVNYSTQTLRAVDFSRGGSVLSLWVEEPKIDTEKGAVMFSGGIPGGYCGRIQGDPSQSNVLGKIVFTVIGAERESATVAITPASEVYLNDGLGTQAELRTAGAVFSIGATPTIAQNPWIAEVEADTVPPDAFTVQLESTRGVFGGKYYIVFSTVDKQSGLDHFEIYEKGGWKRIGSPYELKDQFLREEIQVRAIDKAGNERMGDVPDVAPPPRQFSASDVWPLLSVVGAIILVILFIGVKMYLDRRRVRTSPILPDSPEV